MPDIQTTDVTTFLALGKMHPILDARSEGEYNQGHITGAISFPILNNEERALVGTCYKQKGHDAAVLLGYELAGPKFKSFIEHAFTQFPDKKVLLHCFRGGLRSKIMAWVLHTAGFDITLLHGGYKAYRNDVAAQFLKPYQFLVLGGYTGSEKTPILHLLASAGETIIDIEAMANHRGSAYGAIGLPEQPTNEQFENNLAMALAAAGTEKIIWIEDESRKTGTVVLPEQIYEAKMNAPLFIIDKTKQERMKSIIELYGSFDKVQLINATQKIEKKIGNLRMRQAIEAISAGDYPTWLNIVLDYYDQTYSFGIARRLKEKIIRIKAASNEMYVQHLLEAKNTLLKQKRLPNS
jgi:tRNA 2-selenouridine synthase